MVSPCAEAPVRSSQCVPSALYRWLPFCAMVYRNTLMVLDSVEVTARGDSSLYGMSAACCVVLHKKSLHTILALPVALAPLLARLRPLYGTAAC